MPRSYGEIEKTLRPFNVEITSDAHVYTEKDFPELSQQEKIDFLMQDATDMWWIPIVALRRKLGDAEGLKAAEEALEEYGKKMGEQILNKLMAEGTIKERNIHAWTVMKARGRSAYGHRWIVIELSDKKAIQILQTCPGAEVTFPKLDKTYELPPNVCWTMEAVERGMIKALHPKATLTPINRMYKGRGVEADPHCMTLAEIP